MKRFLTTFLFCLLLSAALPCGAQNTRPWTAGPLSWSEFSQVQGEDAASYASFSVGKAECSLFGGVGYTSWKKGVVMNHPLACGLTLSEGITADIPLHRTYNFLAKSPQAQDLGVRVKLYVDEMYVAAQKTVMPTVNLSVGVNFGFTKLSRAE